MGGLATSVADCKQDDVLWLMMQVVTRGDGGAGDVPRLMMRTVTLETKN